MSSFHQGLIVPPSRDRAMPWIASLPASSQEVDIESVRTSDVLLPYSWADDSVYSSNLQSPEEEVP